jgi:hypothetical protein
VVIVLLLLCWWLWWLCWWLWWLWSGRIGRKHRRTCGPKREGLELQLRAMERLWLWLWHGLGD